jgi:mono/diheme cytochrome c family protein
MLPRTAARTALYPAHVARLGTLASKYAFAIVAVVAIGGAILLGVHQGRSGNEDGFDDAPPTTATTQPPFQSEQEAAKGQPVKDAFAHTCGTCHTLRRAGVKGIIGPDLDKVVLTRAKVRRMIATGSLDTVMPKNLLVGKDADRVAKYVAEQSLASRRARAKR